MTPKTINYELSPRRVAFFFVTCASKPSSGTGHSETRRAKARRDLGCTKGVASLRAWSPGRRPGALQSAKPGTSGRAGTWRASVRHHPASTMWSVSKASSSAAREPLGLLGISQRARQLEKPCKYCTTGWQAACLPHVETARQGDPSTPRGRSAHFQSGVLALYLVPWAILPLFSTSAASAMSVGCCFQAPCAVALCALLGCWLSLVDAGVPASHTSQITTCCGMAHLSGHCATRG